MSFHGIIIYEIVENGDILRGIYTNTELNNRFQIMNEIVKKKSQKEDSIAGIYSCRFMENGNKAYKGELVIQKKNEVYEFSWKVENDNKSFVDTFKGIGLKAGNNYLAVSYWYIT